MASGFNAGGRSSRSGRLRLDLFGVVGWTVAAALLVLIVYPLVSTLVREFVVAGALNPEPMRKVLADPQFYISTRNTGTVLLTAGTAALLIAAVFAWLNERTDARFGIISDVLPLVPLLIPPIALSVGWVLLAQERAGFLNGFLQYLLTFVGVEVTEGPLRIGTWPGMLFVYTIAFVPYAYLVLAAALRNMDTSLEEASRMSGAGAWYTLRKVSLPAILPAMASAALLVVIVGVSFFSIPRTIGSLGRIDTVSVYIVRLTATFPSRLDEAVAVSLLLLLFVGVAWVLHQRVLAVSRQVTIGGKSGNVTVVRLGKWRWLARAVMVLYLIAVSALPFAALVVVSLQPFWQPAIDVSQLSLDNIRDFFFLADSRPRDALFNSIRLGLIGATLAMTVAGILIAYGHERKGYRKNLIEGVTKVPGAISNLVIGVAILVALGGPPFNLRGTLLILLLAYLVIYMPQASIAAEAARSQVGDELLEASAISGAAKFRTTRSVLFPLMRPGLLAGWALVFVVVAGDLTASAILAGPGNVVVGSIFLQIWETGRFPNLGALGTAICVTTASVVTISLALGRRRQRSRKAPQAAAATTPPPAAAN